MGHAPYRVGSPGRLSCLSGVGRAGIGVTAADGPLIEMREVSKQFGNPARKGGGVLAADRVSLTLAQSPPRILSIVGESGSGKTTVARALLGLSAPTSA